LRSHLLVSQLQAQPGFPVHYKHKVSHQQARPTRPELRALSSWPEGTRLILRKERPHPRRPATFIGADGCRITALLTDTANDWWQPSADA